MKDKLANLNNIVSLILGIVTIVEWILKFTLVHILISLGAILLVWMCIIAVIWARIPWNRNFRPAAMVFKKGNVKRFFSVILHRPLYESEYICPKYDSQYMDKDEIEAGYSDRITVIIEDDPVGFICNTGCMYPALAVNEDFTHVEVMSAMRSVEEEILEKKLLFIATPSRRLDEKESCNLNDKIGQAVKKFFAPKGIEVRIVSKIDSCLRSNYEPEYEGLVHGYGSFSLEVLIPSYIEQGRVTVYGGQYLSVDGRMKPVHESEFASFKGLEFRNSNLALWAEKKSRHLGGRKNVGVIDIDQLRSANEEEIAGRILNRPSNVKMIVFDSQDVYDLSKIMKVLSMVEASEKSVFYKFGPSMINKLVEVYSERQATAGACELAGIKESDTGVFIAGSLTTTTKLQIANLRDESCTSIVLISEEDIEAKNNIGRIIEKKTKKVIEQNGRGDNVILTTEFWKRSDSEYPTSGKRDSVLMIFAEIARKIKDMPNRWFLFKGSDTALYTITNGFGVRTFYYCGQLIPGVIHCRCHLGQGTMKSFFIVGGNVGDEDLLVRFLGRMKLSQ